MNRILGRVLLNICFYYPGMCLVEYLKCPLCWAFLVGTWVQIILHMVEKEIYGNE
jgi:hypothetical protein